MSIFNLIHTPGRIRMCIFLLIGLIPLTAVLTGCKKFVEVDPSITQPSADIVYNNDAAAASVLTGVYADLAGLGIANGTQGISLIGGLAADELTAYPPTDPVIQSAYINAFSSTDNPQFWNRLYFYIYTTNSMLENLAASPAVRENVRQQLTGEAKFVRAFCYFYLVNFYGDVPLILTADYRKNAGVARTAKSAVWEQIFSDLNAAKALLDENYREADGVTAKATTERVRPNKGAVTALLARCYLYANEWAKAETEATEIIDNASVYQIESDLNNTFLKASKEAIWQLQPVQPDYNTFDGYAFVLTSVPDYSSPVSLSDDVFNTFDSADLRKLNWIGAFDDGAGTIYHFPNKYKVKVDDNVTEYLMVMRLAEIYLVRAEARAQQDNVAGAAVDLNIIRSRAGLPVTAAITQEEMLDAIYQERRKELFTEWAHRWLDLKRTGRVDEVMSVVTPLKGGTWNTNWQWFPIPYQSAIDTNPNITQNPGY